MSPLTRVDVLNKVTGPNDKRPEPGPDGVGAGLDFSWKDLGPVTEGLAFAMRPIRIAARNTTRRFGLGPRGAFILSLISGGARYPLELAMALKAGRSLITAELTKLTEAGLVTARPGKEDKRRSELTLTPKGEEASREVRGEMARIVNRNLAGYSVEEVRLFARMLRDVRRLEGEEEDFC